MESANEKLSSSNSAAVSTAKDAVADESVLPKGIRDALNDFIENGKEHGVLEMYYL